MQQTSQDSLSSDGKCSNAGNKKKPFEIFTNIFRRKSKPDHPCSECNGVEHPFIAATEDNSDVGSGPGAGAEPHPASWRPPSSAARAVDMRATPSPAIPIPRQSTSLTDLLPKSPVSPRVKNLEEDMEALRLSRQDNPFIVQQLERLSLQDDTYLARPSELSLSPKHPFQQIEGRGMTSADSCPLLDDEAENVNVHEHLIRSPPPQFPQKISQFMFPSKSPTHRSTDTVNSPLTPNPLSPTLSSSFSVDNQSTVGTPSKPRNSFSGISFSCDTSGYKDRKLKGLSPLLAKSGADVLDPGMKEVLEFQKQRLFADHSPSSDSRRSSDSYVSSSQRTLGDVAVPQVKWRNSTASPVTLSNGTGSLPGLSGSTSVSSVSSVSPTNVGTSEGHLGPIRDGKSKAVGLTPSLSVQDLLVSNPSASASPGPTVTSLTPDSIHNSKFGRPLQGMFCPPTITRTGSREALLDGTGSSPGMDSG